MDPPSLRELELETLLRERNSQVAALTDEVNQLRKYLSNQPAPSRSDPVSLPPALLALLQPYVSSNPSSTNHGLTSTTMTAALMQRSHVLQEENEELYELLRLSETGKLKEEVRCLKRVVSRLDRALKDSHGTISSLTDELDKSYSTFLSHQKSNDAYSRDSLSPPRNSGRSAPTDSSGSNNNGDLKPIPTGPRAYKKPRLSETQASPARSNATLPASNTTQGSSNRPSRRERSPRSGDGRGFPSKEARMDLDVDVKKGRQGSRDRSRDRQRERERDRDRQRERDRAREHRDHGRDAERHKEKDKDKDKERDRDRSRRNGAQGGRGSGGGSGRKGARGNTAQDIGDRTLRQRMGL
ncbi:hypothetical protein DFH11DRAFT_1723260 [Phellopilus nigrolimitatus]|nr:hypothetical protein DFH11DRAFT_1723260 [Phellopilus nigrolimitatus]